MKNSCCGSRIAFLVARPATHVAFSSISFVSSAQMKLPVTADTRFAVHPGVLVDDIRRGQHDRLHKRLARISINRRSWCKNKGNVGTSRPTEAQAGGRNKAFYFLFCRAFHSARVTFIRISSSLTGIQEVKAFMAFSKSESRRTSRSA